MASLVADYDSSSDHSEESADCDQTEPKTDRNDVLEAKTSIKTTNVYYEVGSDGNSSEEEENQPKKGLAENRETTKLPKPEFATSISAVTTRGTDFEQASVFANPFLAAEEAKILALERHVKMTANADDHPRTINGRQVCWNYRKGRCRFGHNCKFAHDSDLSSVSCEKQKTITKPKLGRSGFRETEKMEEVEEDEDETNVSRQKRKKPGLSNTLVPPKRSMKAFQKQQKQEQPWLSKKPH